MTSIVFTGPSSAPGAPYQMYARFTDQTSFLWNCTTPVSNSLWTGRFMDTPKALPQSYLNVVVMNNTGFTFAWPTTTGSTLNTFSVPTGNITLQTLMNSIFNASKANITADQYYDMIGQPPPDPNSNVTVANAIQVNAVALQYTSELFTINQETSNLLRICC